MDADIVFAALDLDGDGYVSRDELSLHLSAAGYSQFAASNILELCCEAEGITTRSCLRERFARFATLRQAPGLVVGNEACEEAAAFIRAKADELFDQIRLQGEHSIRQAECAPQPQQR